MAIFKVTLKVPESVFDDQKAVQRIADAQRRKTGPDIRRMFMDTVDGWKHKPDWSVVQNIGSSRIAIRVTPNGENANQYAIVNQGSPRHSITSRRGGLLRFQTGYRAATSPRLLRSRPASRFGAFISTPAVDHPGFEAREFDSEIAEQYYDTFAADMQSAIAGK